MDKRRYDIDALRSIAMFLLISYHLGISFTFVAPYISFVQNKETTESIWIFLGLLNTWRIPLVFLISGIALRLSFEKRGKSQILRERLKMLGLPYIFGSLTFGAASIAITATYYEGWSGEYLWLGIITIFDGVHLWFLKNILFYSLIVIPVLNLVANKDLKDNFISKLLDKPGGVFFFSLPVILQGHLFNKIDYASYANTSHGFVLGFIWFFMGILLVSQGDSFWKSNIRNWKIHLFIGLVLYFYRLINSFETGFALDNRLVAFESFNFIFAMLGLGATYLNKSSPQLTYYKTAVYPVYIVHLPVQMGLMYYFADVNLHPIIKFPLVLFLIIFISLTIYHAVKNIKFLRPLFGLRKL